MSTKKKKNSRCKFIDKEGNKCKKKLTLVDKSIVCRCGKCFCTLHRTCESHNCQADLAQTKEVDVEGGGKFKKIDKI